VQDSDTLELQAVPLGLGLRTGIRDNQCWRNISNLVVDCNFVALAVVSLAQFCLAGPIFDAQLPVTKDVTVWWSSQIIASETEEAYLDCEDRCESMDSGVLDRSPTHVPTRLGNKNRIGKMRKEARNPLECGDLESQRRAYTY
jgi:hypothetical protein